MPSDIKLVIFDCDLTLWNNADVSELKRPFVSVSPDTVRDREGTEVSLFPQVRAVLAALEQRGYLMSIATWNIPEPAFDLMALYGIRRYFCHPKAEGHPDKAAMIADMIEDFAADGMHISPDQVVFTDDRTLHTNDILARLPGLHVLQMWVDVKDHNDLLAWLDAYREIGYSHKTHG
jgi:magnesium-dependent phosphatase-1